MLRRAAAISAARRVPAAVAAFASGGIFDGGGGGRTSASSGEQRLRPWGTAAAALLLSAGAATAASSASSSCDSSSSSSTTTTEGRGQWQHQRRHHHHDDEQRGQQPRRSLVRRFTPPAEPHPGASPKPSSMGTDDICEDAPTLECLPVYRSADVAVNDGQDGRPIWMSYGGVVYDVTNFVKNHPGGSEKILTAAGAAMEPFWNIYRQHYSSDLPMRMMEQMMIGTLHETDQAAVDDMMERETDDDHNPFSNEPERHPALIVHNDQPMNAEVPSELLTRAYLTSNALFYVRNHHPVPLLDEDELRDYSVQIDLSALGGKGSKGEGSVVDLSLDDLKHKFPKTEVVATVQCAGNRRSCFNEHGNMRTSGTPWGQGAISTARWGGVRLVDVLRYAAANKNGGGGGGSANDIAAAADASHLEHVIFESLDGMVSSIPSHKALAPRGDVLLAYEMNGQPLGRDHGHPLRLIVPGYSAVRSVKWLSRIELSREEAEGPWQRGLNYKILPPGVTDAGSIDLEQMPSVMEATIYSGVTGVERVRDASSVGGDGNRTLERKLTPRQRHATELEAEEMENSSSSSSSSLLRPGDRVVVRATGWAWAGGGRKVVRVDVTGDGGRTWSTADVGAGGNEQRSGRAWAWVLWKADVHAVVGEDGRTVEVASKAVDEAFNIQPEHCDSGWNVRGLGNSSWYRATAKVA